MNKYNQFYYHKGILYLMNKKRSNGHNNRTSRKYKRQFNVLDIKFFTKGWQHYNDNSYYYFDGQYKGRRYQFINGSGILELRTDTYVKRFDDDPILGWRNRGLEMKLKDEPLKEETEYEECEEGIDNEDYKDYEDYSDIKVGDAETLDAQFIINKIFDNIPVFQSVTLNFRRCDLKKVLSTLIEYNDCDDLDFILHHIDNEDSSLKIIRKCVIVNK